MKKRLHDAFMEYGDPRFSSTYTYNFRVKQSEDLEEILLALDIPYQIHKRLDGDLTVTARVGELITC